MDFEAGDYDLEHDEGFGVRVFLNKTQANALLGGKCPLIHKLGFESWTVVSKEEVEFESNVEDLWRSYRTGEINGKEFQKLRNELEHARAPQFRPRG